MKIINIDEKEEVNKFVGGEAHSQFLQSYEWGEFQEKVGGSVFRIGVEDNGEIIASAKIIRKKLPIGKHYFYCARGPIVHEKIKNRKEVLNLLFSEVERMGLKDGAMFLRFDPIYNVDDHVTDIAGKDIKIIQTHSVQPPKTTYLDLSKTEEELLAKMHQKTRYNIRLAEKKGVKIIEVDKSRFEEFWHLLDQTCGRDKFRPHGRNYYQAMLELPNDFLKLCFAEYENKPIAAGMFTFFGDTATYLHGGSSNDHRELMAPYLLQWKMIQLAKEKGFKYFDFHGIDEVKYPGVTRFKKNFGGEKITYPGTFDLVYDEGWYQIYKMIRKVRRTF